MFTWVASQALVTHAATPTIKDKLKNNNNTLFGLSTPIHAYFERDAQRKENNERKKQKSKHECD